MWQVKHVLFLQVAPSNIIHPTPSMGNLKMKIHASEKPAIEIFVMQIVRIKIGL